MPKTKAREYDREFLLKKHPRWLDRQRHRCQFTGKTVGKSVGGVYQRYSFHHTHSEAYGRECPGWNYILLCPFAHWLVHNVLGGAWFSDRDVTVQNRRAKMLPLPWLWRYPNLPQRIFHGWCRLPMILRQIILLCCAIDWLWRLWGLE